MRSNERIRRLYSRILTRRLGKKVTTFIGRVLLDKEHIEKRRMLFSGAHELSMDDQGRIVLPKSLTDYMKLEDGTVTIIGVGDHFEIWDTKRWTQYSNDQAM